MRERKEPRTKPQGELTLRAGSYRELRRGRRNGKITQTKQYPPETQRGQVQKWGGVGGEAPGPRAAREMRAEESI